MITLTQEPKKLIYLKNRNYENGERYPAKNSKKCCSEPLYLLTTHCAHVRGIYHHRAATMGKETASSK
jgi:hypothetical protein